MIDRTIFIACEIRAMLHQAACDNNVWRGGVASVLWLSMAPMYWAIMLGTYHRRKRLRDDLLHRYDWCMLMHRTTRDESMLTAASTAMDTLAKLHIGTKG